MLLIFTDLDGTLLNPDDYRYDAALPVLKTLTNQSVPIVPVTSKTRTEVEALCEEMGLHEPFITENGSGIFFHPNDTRFDLTALQEWGGYRLKRLGCTYDEARRGLQTISTMIGKSLRGFGDLTIQDIQDLTGLDIDGACRAKLRDFTEPFVTPKDLAPSAIKDSVNQIGFKVTVGDRFSHLIGVNAGKGWAVDYLIQVYQAAHPRQVIQTIGLGNSPNDLEMLNRVHTPIVIPGPKGPHPELDNRGWVIAEGVGASGWASALKTLLDLLT